VDLESAILDLDVIHDAPEQSLAPLVIELVEAPRDEPAVPDHRSLMVGGADRFGDLRLPTRQIVQ
jgi:hypothetical protein